MTTRDFSKVAVIALLAAQLSCGGDGYGPSNGGGNNDVNSVNASPSLVFAPNLIQVQRGGSVKWVFGTVEHNVTFAATTGAPANIDGSINTEISRTFNTAGTYTYQCTLHQGMSGTVSVLGTIPGGY